MTDREKWIAAFVVAGGLFLIGHILAPDAVAARLFAYASGFLLGTANQRWKL